MLRVRYLARNYAPRSEPRVLASNEVVRAPLGAVSASFCRRLLVITIMMMMMMMN